MIYIYKNIKENKLIALKEKIEKDNLKYIESIKDIDNKFLKESNFKIDFFNSNLYISYNDLVKYVFIETNIRIIYIDLNNLNNLILPRNEYILSFCLYSKSDFIFNYIY